MEVRMHPRTDSNQRCLTFSLSVSPRCRVFSYRDHLGNNVHHFDIPGQHEQLVIIAESLVEQQPLAEIPSFLAPDAWRELDAIVAEGDYWEMLLPSEFAATDSGAARSWQASLDVCRRDDPMMLLRELNQAALRLLQLFAANHARGFADRRSASFTAGRLPGFRPHHDRPGAAARAFRAATSAAISITARKITTARPRMRRMPGSRRCCRIWAGWASIRPTR